MTEKDLKLIADANKYHPFNWYEIDENAADTSEAREILRRRKSYLYHMDEAGCGLL